MNNDVNAAIKELKTILHNKHISPEFEQQLIAVLNRKTGNNNLGVIIKSINSNK